MHYKDTVKPWDKGTLQVSENHKYLQNGDSPFFWMGDTAWLLFQHLNREQIRVYLNNRRQKYFNVIQATLVHSFPKTERSGDGGPLYPNGKGTAVLDNDFGRPNLEGGYWDQVDEALDIAESLGLYMGLLPCWGSMVKQGFLNLENAGIYGSFLADRYGKRKNVIWIIGGDCRGSDGYDVWMKLARTIKEKCPRQLMGYHPFGRTSSSLWFNEAQWLDFNMFQSGHRRYDQCTLGEWDDNSKKEGWFGEDNWRYVKRDHEASVLRPTLDGEPSYEQIPQGLHDTTQPFWKDHDARRYAYWSVLEGACGHTYGHNAVMQFFDPLIGPGNYGASAPWQQSIHAPGSGQMGHLVSLMTSLDFINGRPSEELLAQPQKENYGRVSVFQGKDYVLCYTYTGEPFQLDLSQLSHTFAEAAWYDPASGVLSSFGEQECKGVAAFEPPSKPIGQNDWVLVLRGK